MSIQASPLSYKMALTTNEKWQILMKACRKLCKALNEDFNEPPYEDFDAGRNYYQSLLGRVRLKNNRKG
jgi:hypothetical protein